jgi:predicted Zn-dependent peptidase
LSLPPFDPRLLAQTAPLEQLQKPSAEAVEIPFQEYRLKNGLRVVLSEDHAAPTYSLCVTYNVGSRDERPGRTGFAHLFEHMMFQGSRNVGKGEHSILILNNGGSANGTTNVDRTNYFETLPANQLELGLFLESDRMRSLNVNRQNLDNQRHTVQEERRQNYDNRPYGKTYEAVLDTAYDNFAYKHSTIGSMEDLNRATVEDAADFFKRYYAPNNGVLSLVGDFKTDEALALIKKYFENIPAQPPPPAVDMTEPEQKGERRRTLEDAFAQTPHIDIVYKIPPGNTPDWYALDVLGDVLAAGASSRLYKKLIKEKELAVSVSAGPHERRGPSLFQISISARTVDGVPEIEKIVYEELERLASEPVAEWELEKVRMQSQRQQIESLYSTRTRASLLGQYAVYYNDPRLINTVLSKIAQIANDDLQRVGRAYLKETNRTVVITAPKAKSTPVSK